MSYPDHNKYYSDLIYHQGTYRNIKNSLNKAYWNSIRKEDKVNKKLATRKYLRKTIRARVKKSTKHKLWQNY